RSRQHRFLLAAYSGAGLAIALAYTKSLIYGYSSAPWNELNHPLLVATLVVLIFGVIGARAVFVLPVSVRANWIFRLTAVHSPKAYFAAVRKSVYVLTAIPILLITIGLLFGIWPTGPALEHAVMLTLVGILAVEISLHQFRKIPFACSYLPGGSNV